MSRQALGAIAAAVGMVCLVCPSAGFASGFGVSRFTLETTRPVVSMVGGKVVSIEHQPYAYSQAGGHPVGITGTLELNSEASPTGGFIPAGGDPKDAVTYLPAGLLGDPVAVPRCEIIVFTKPHGRCPVDSQVGEAEVAFSKTLLVEPIFDLVPEKGQSAEFGIPTGESINVVLTGHVVRVDGKYTLALVSNGIPARGSTRFTLTFWGVPADPITDPERGRRCETSEVGVVPLKCSGPTPLVSEGGLKSGVAQVPFLTMPSDCTGGPQSASVEVDSWQNPGVYVSGPQAVLPQATGCDGLSFAPSVEVAPETLLDDAPIGLGVNLQVPQPEIPSIPSTPELRNATVTLPAGVSVNPSVVGGIQACNQTGPEGLNLLDESHESEQLGPDGEKQLAPGKCPNASIIGTAEVFTPLLPEPVKGHLYLARPLCGGVGQEACTEQDALNGRLYRVYLEVGGTGALADAGVNFKAEGVVSANPATGQLTTTFTNNPQLPFGELKLHLYGGAQASLANPQACGEARTTTDLSAWSAPGLVESGSEAGRLVTGTPDADPSSYYVVEGCNGPPGLSPGFLAGTVTPQAGGYTPFTLNLTRKDGEQYLSGVQVHTPSGLLGMLAGVPLCEEPAAAQGTCPESSRIGSTTVASGAGGSPFEIGGAVYLTKSYKGAPFGLSVVTHAVAGPYNLGLVVVRARIDVDRENSTLTVTSDPFPQIIFGVPLRLQRVSVRIDRPNFMFNPTNCKQLQIAASVAGAQGAVANVMSPFAVGGCKSLEFKPTLKITTSGRTNRRIGASLDAKLTFPNTPEGTQANVAKVKVSLPRQLPSRLPTLQHACPARIFNANPVDCPPRSIVGIARTTTPVLPVELSGPVYFVSHGGEAFPSLIVVLQGDGVRVDVTGTTFINEKTNITTSTFKTIPDVPVHSFELYLPQGANSALAANTNLCGIVVKRRVRRPLALVMPTEFQGQNGAVVRQNIKVSITGCPRKVGRSMGGKRK